MQVIQIVLHSMLLECSDRRRVFLNNFSTSSSVLPFVSGTNTRVKKKANNITTLNDQKAPQIFTGLTYSLKVPVTIAADVQFMKVAMPTPTPRISSGIISEVMTQGNAPQAIEKPMMYIIKLTIANQVKLSLHLDESSSGLQNGSELKK